MTVFDTLLREQRLVVTVGPGGVGKTTTAAALALGAAALGRRALVITIDPARRLADALGLDALEDEIRRVPAVSSPLSAAMLDTKKSFDALMARLAQSDEERRLILENPAYHAFSRTLARSHAYVAMERVYDVLHGGDFDLVVLDTPPTRSALDILDAPGRLVRFLDDQVVESFLRGADGGLGGGAIGLLARLAGDYGVAELELERQIATGLYVDLFPVVTGGELLSFFQVLAHLRGGFRERAATMDAVLRAPDTAFVLVSAPMATSLGDAAFLRAGLLARDVPPARVVMNRAYWSEPGHPEAPALSQSPDPHPDPAVAAVRASIAQANAARAEAAARFAGASPFVSVPELEDEVRDADALRAMLAAARGA